MPPAERLVYVNGAFLPAAEAKIPVFDRGFLFADGVYEVTAVLDGGLVDHDAHMARLERSLGEIALAAPAGRQDLTRLHFELVRRNSIVNGLVYLQVTRGIAERDFRFPPDARPSLVMFTQERDLPALPEAETGIAVKSVPDIRWKRRDIKSVALLAQVLAKQEAAEAGCGEAWLVEDGLVTEGASSSAFIITTDGRVIARPLSPAILPGITRVAVLRLAEEQGLSVEPRAFSLDEAHAAAEAFNASSGGMVMPVVAIDGRPVGDGRPGRHTRQLRDIYLETARASALRQR